MGTTKIEWTSSLNPNTGKWMSGFTFNPWIGCTKVQPGCDNCYAEALAGRHKWANWGPGQPRKLTSDANWRKPLNWDRQAKAGGYRIKIFCASLSDVFDTEVPDEWRYRLFELINRTTNTNWLLLTKRSSEPGRFVHDVDWSKVWLGTSIDDDKYAYRAEQIMRVPAEVFWISYEPALGPLSLTNLHPDIQWVVVGGESQQDREPARAFNLAWARSLLVERGSSRKPAIFVKQLGSHPVWEDRKGFRYSLPLPDSKGVDWSHWPPDLRVREFPDGTAIQYED
jgi:protein gp37